MLKLKFDIIFFYYQDGSYENYKKYNNVERNLNENLTLKEVALILYNEFKLDNGTIESQLIPRMNELFWKQYFSSEIYEKLDIDDKKYLNTRIGDLEKQFNISKITIPLLLNKDGIGKAGGIKDGVKFYFHHNESDIHHAPHIHCSYSGEEISVEIETLKVTGKPFKKTKMDVVFKVITEHKQELRNYWNKAVVNGESIPFKLEL